MVVYWLVCLLLVRCVLVVVVDCWRSLASLFVVRCVLTVAVVVLLVALWLLRIVWCVLLFDCYLLLVV